MKKTLFLFSFFIVLSSFGGLNAQKMCFNPQNLDDLYTTQIALAAQDPELCIIMSSQQNKLNVLRKTPDKLVKALQNQAQLVKFLKNPTPLLKALQKTKRAWRV